MNNASGSIHLR